MKTKEELLETLKQAINDKSSDGLFEALSNLIENQTDSKAEQILQEALRVDDSNILKARGARQLTSAEKAFYNKVIDAMRSDNFRQSIDNIEAGGYMHPLKKPLNVGSIQWLCFISYLFSMYIRDYPLFFADNLCDNHLSKVD